MKTKLNINVNISLMILNLVGIAICFFLTSRDFYYAVETFFGLHEGESKTLFFISAFGFEAGIVIYTIGKKKDENEWQDYVFMVASCAVNTIYLCCSSYTKNGFALPPLIAAVVLGCVFPLIVLWLSVQLRERFWGTVSLKESQYNETILSEELTEKISELEKEKIDWLAKIQQNELAQIAQNDTKFAQSNQELAQKNEELAQSNITLAQSNQKFAQEHTELAQKNEAFAQSNKEFEQANQDLAQKYAALVLEQKSSAQKQEALAQEMKAIEQKNERLEQEKQVTFETLQEAQKENKMLLAQQSALTIENEALKRNKAVLRMDDNIKEHIYLLRKFTDNQNKNKEVADKALLDYKQVVEQNIILTSQN